MPAGAAPLHVHVLIDSLTWGGAEMLLGDLALAAPGAGLRLSVGYLTDVDGSPAARRLRAAGVEPELVGATGMLSAGSLRRVGAQLARLRPDVVHTQLPYADVLGGLAARRIGIPAVSTIHLIGRAPGEPPGLRGAARTRLAALVRRHTCARVLAVSDAARAAYLAAGRDVPSRVLTVHNGIARPAPRRSRADVRGELGLAPQAVVAAMVTVLRPGKGHAVAIEATLRLAERRPELMLLLVGDGPERERIARLARPLGARAVLAGHRADVTDVLAAVDVLLHPTVIDAFPTALLEAAATGLPVVATRVGGIPEIVEDGRTGLLVDAPPRAEAVATALGRLLDAPALRREMGASAATRFAREFSANRWAARLREVYLESARERGHRG